MKANAIVATAAPLTVDTGTCRPSAYDHSASFTSDARGCNRCWIRQ